MYSSHTDTVLDPPRHGLAPRRAVPSLRVPAPAPRRVDQFGTDGLLPGTDPSIEAEAVRALQAVQIVELQRQPIQHPAALAALFSP